METPDNYHQLEMFDDEPQPEVGPFISLKYLGAEIHQIPRPDGTDSVVVLLPSEDDESTQAA